MKYHEVKDLLFKEKLVVIIRRVAPEKMGDLSKALVRGGIKLMEITFDQASATPLEDYKACYTAVKEAVGDDLCVGAGTVMTVEQLECLYSCGGKFFLAPNTNEAVIRRAKELDMVAIPGAMTPSEIAAAWEYGADMVKLFPADDVGYHYIQNIRGPLPHIPLMATGGVNPNTIPKFFDCGMNAFGTGITIVNRDMLNAGDFAGIEVLAREHVEAIKNYNT